LPVLRGAPPAPRLLAEPPHARVLRPVGAVHARPGPPPPLQGGHPPADLPHSRRVAAAAQRDAPHRPVADHTGPAAAVRRLGARRALPARAPAVLSAPRGQL